MTDIDAGIIEQYADHLYRKAAARVTCYTIAGALLGALAGAVASGLLHLTSQPLIPSHLGYATLLIGAAALGFYGYRLGGQRAFGLRLQAQLALHQLQVERTILAPPAAPPAPAPVAVAPPAAPPAPAPVAPAPPAAPPLPAPAAVAPAPPLTAPVVQPAPAPAPPLTPAPVAPPAPEPTPPAVTAPAPVAPPRLVEPPPLAAPPLTPPVSAGR